MSLTKILQDLSVRYTFIHLKKNPMQMDQTENGIWNEISKRENKN